MKRARRLLRDSWPSNSARASCPLKPRRCLRLPRCRRCGVIFEYDEEGNAMSRSIESEARRRQLLRFALAGGALTALEFSALIRAALAAEPRAARQGVREARGDVRVNGQPVQAGAPVNPGDNIETGADSRTLIVINRDAFMLRDNSRLESHA